MDQRQLRELLLGVQQGQISVEESLQRLKILPYEEMGFAKIDHHRALRRGFPEVVFGQGKSIPQIVAITQKLAAQSGRVLVTRAGEDCFSAVHKELPAALYNPLARAITIRQGEEVEPRPGVTVICAGTADIPVAEEASVTAELMDNQVERAYDVGVAGIHRLFDCLPLLQGARVVVAVAGMEGALPSVVGGLVAAPVIAVPTSVGYGASFGGLAALLAMLSSCAPGVAVVNIDNGFGAGYLAGMINRNAI
ncbi:MAG: nickel pincer cofactor biosynthesis protein LarB [Dehalococcoidia bacterium]|nr:nickel pincer cofactor biosynthesis protein LarB [Dehalococcoidia bacterium]